MSTYPDVLCSWLLLPESPRIFTWLTDTEYPFLRPGADTQLHLRL